jgi:exopolysaccharide biosynthesis polyprenyl glycosylphosphotransferase
MNRSIRLAVLSDLASISIAFGISFTVRFLNPEGTRAALPFAVSATVLIALVWLAALTLNGAYRWTLVSNGVTDMKLLLQASVIAFAATSTISFIFKTEYSRIFILVGFPIGVILMMVGRRWVRIHTSKSYSSGSISRNILVLENQEAEHSIRALITESPELGMNIVKCVDSELKNGQSVDSWVTELISAVASANVDAVVIDQGLHLDNVTIAELSWKLDQVSVELLVVPEFLGVWASRLEMQRHPSLPLIQLAEPRLNPVQGVQKRILDLVLVIPTFLFLFLPLAIVGTLVKITSNGPMLFVQPRVGAEGKPFPFYKFRSMRNGADLERQDVLGRPDEEMVDRYRADPRITPLGRFIRRFSIDELPQLWNVVTGTMSLVGPRPMLFEELAQLEDFHHRRHLAKPGLTGLWQISGRKDTTWEERMLLDLYYINRWSLSLDLAIIAKTFRVVLSGKGSY